MALKDEYFTISEAAKEIKVTRQTISRWIKDGILTTEKVGRAVLIRKDALYQHNEKRLFEEKRSSIEGQLISFIREKYNYTDEDEIVFTGLDIGLDIDLEAITIRGEFGIKYGFIVTLKNGIKEKVLIQLGKPENLIRNKGEPFILIGIRKQIEDITKVVIPNKEKGVVR